MTDAEMLEQIKQILQTDIRKWSVEDVANLYLNDHFLGLKETNWESIFNAAVWGNTHKTIQ